MEKMSRKLWLTTAHRRQPMHCNVSLLIRVRFSWGFFFKEESQLYT